MGLQTAVARMPAAIISTMQFRLAMVTKTSRRGMALKKSHMEPSTIRLWRTVAKIAARAMAREIGRASCRERVSS